MRYWVFHEEQLAAALTAFEARRMGVVPQTPAYFEMIKGDTKLIAEFLASPEAQKHLVGGKA